MQTNDFLRVLFERAKAEGIENCEAYCAQGDSFDVSVFQGEILHYNVASSLGLCFRALIDGKMGYASTQVFDEDAVELLLRGVQENARLIENDDRQFIFEGAKDYPKLELYERETDELSAERKIAMALELEHLVTHIDPRIERVNQCLVVSASGVTRIVNSRGIDVSHRDNYIGAGVQVTAHDGERASSGVRFDCRRLVSEIDLSAIAQRAAKEALDGLEGQSVDSGEYAIALRNDAASDMLSVFDGIFSADMAQKGLSLLKGREGETIASPALTLIDDPLLPSGFASTPFDAEGVPTKRRVVVQNGVLNTLLHNLKTANKQGVETTGNASKPSYASPVGVAPSNFFVEPSDTSFEALLSAMGDGLLITELKGLHAGADMVSGDFSLGARGYRVREGKLCEAVGQITVAGNFFQLLKDVRGVASDLEFGLPSGACEGSPTLWIDKLTVAGR